MLTSLLCCVPMLTSLAHQPCYHPVQINSKYIHTPANRHTICISLIFVCNFHGPWPIGFRGHSMHIQLSVLFDSASIQQSSDSKAASFARYRGICVSACVPVSWLLGWILGNLYFSLCPCKLEIQSCLLGCLLGW